MNDLAPSEAMKLTDHPCTKQHFYLELRKLKERNSILPVPAVVTVGDDEDDTVSPTTKPDNSGASSSLTESNRNNHATIMNTWWLKYAKKADNNST